MKEKISAREAAIRLVIMRKYTTKTLRQKLLEKGYDEDEIEKTLSGLGDYLDDRDYALSYVKDAFNIKKVGSKRIIMELNQRGIDEDTARNAIDESGIDEKEVLREIYLRRFDENDDKQKIIKYFLSRGFDYYDLKEIMND